jgi:hypothetical protein
MEIRKINDILIITFSESQAAPQQELTKNISLGQQNEQGVCQNLI